VALVAEVARSIGLRPIDAGPLRFAHELEAMALLNIALQLRHGLDWRSAWKLVGVSDNVPLERQALAA
jgi:predicted dinucleotide-binding enzyme